MAFDIDKHTGALISDDKEHRLSLWRIWNVNDEKNKVLFIGVNPSRGDAHFNDPTITRCINFASKWGYDGMYFGNLYSFRTPDPRELRQNINKAVHPNCDWELLSMASQCRTVVFCWGSHDFIIKRVTKVVDLMKQMQCMCFGLNQDNNPKHPLYLSKTSQLKPWKKTIGQ